MDVHGQVFQCELSVVAYVEKLLRVRSASSAFWIVVERDEFVSGGVGDGCCWECEVLVESPDILLRIGAWTVLGAER